MGKHHHKSYSRSNSRSNSRSRSSRRSSHHHHSHKKRNSRSRSKSPKYSNNKLNKNIKNFTNKIYKEKIKKLKFSPNEEENIEEKDKIFLLNQFKERCMIRIKVF